MRALDREQIAAAWHRVRAGVFSVEQLRRLFTYNLPLKLLALAVAFGLWIFVNFGERDTEESLKVPMELRNIPAHLMITSPRVDFIDLRVVGPRTLLGRIDHDRLSLSLDLSGVRPGPAVFRVEGESLNLPRGVKVVRINPAQVTLELERFTNKYVPVRLRLVGKPSNDLQVVSTKVSPETVQVSGPTSDIEDVHAAYTQELDISTAAAGTIERELPLDPVSDYVLYSANRVAAQVRIEEQRVTREFRKVPVEVRNATHPARVIPDAVRLTVRGPRRVLEELQFQTGSVYVDAQNAEIGEQEVDPGVDLPPGVQLVATDPPKLKLAVSSAKRTRR